jgi:prolipoprotein diacylglyceryl transferase
MVAFIPSPSSGGFHVGPLFVHAYGLMYVLGLAAAIAITVRRWEARGGDRQLVYEVAAWGFPAGIVGGRLYHDITSWNEVPHTWWGPFAVWQGGLGIWGGIAAGTVAGIWVLRRRGADIPAFLDAAAPALLVAQAIGRIGNYFNQELFGGPTSLPWGLEIDPVHRPAGYQQYATFQPTFLYELIWNLSLAWVLVVLDRTSRIRAPGLFALYVTGYSLARIGEELLRVDPAHHILGLRLNFFVAVITTITGMLWFVHIQRHPTTTPWKPSTLLLAGGIAIALSGCAQLTSQHPPTKHGSHGTAPTRRYGSGIRADSGTVRGGQTRRSGDVERVGRGQDVAVQVGDEEHPPRSGLWKQNADVELAGRA